LLEKLNCNPANPANSFKAFKENKTGLCLLGPCGAGINPKQNKEGAWLQVDQLSFSSSWEIRLFFI